VDLSSLSSSSNADAGRDANAPHLLGISKEYMQETVALITINTVLIIYKYYFKFLL
jgi:hypothetical protein